MSAHLRAGAVSRTEAAALRQEAVHSLWSRLFCGPLKMRRVPEEAFFDTEYLFCTGKACFAHRVPQKMPSVQKKGVFMHRMPFPYRKRLFFTPNASENVSRTPGSLFEHGTHIPYHRWPSPVPNANHLATTAHPALRYRMPDTEASCRSGAWRTF